MGVVFCASTVLSLLLCFIDGRRSVATNDSGEPILERTSYGNGKDEVVLEVQMGDTSEEITLEVERQSYRQEEVVQVLKEAEEQLGSWILGKNESLDAVSEDLNLITEIPESGVTVQWSVADSSVINSLGQLKGEAWRKEADVELTARLSLQEQERIVQISVHIVPSMEQEQAEEKQTLYAKLEEENEKTQSPYVVLPTSVNGKSISWYYPKENRAIYVFLLGIILTIGLWFQEKEEKKKAKEERRKELLLEYPKLMSQITLYLGAGMTLRNAWFQMVSEYEKKQGGTCALYQELLHTKHEIESGLSEGECYERFGMRCDHPTYRKFGMLLSQNLRKGARGLVEILRKESVDAFEERKRNARKLGEEAGTKLLLPMVLMLMVVIAMIVVPAYFSIQI
jgi:hypothetical protein